MVNYCNQELCFLGLAKSIYYMIFITADVLNSACFDSSAHKFSLAEMASEAQIPLASELPLVSSPEVTFHSRLPDGQDLSGAIKFESL